VDDLSVAARELIAALEQEGLDYALGGALAYAAWAVPRATLDIDLNLFCAPEEIRSALARLLALGVEGDVEAATRQAEETGVAYLRWRGIRLDVFVPSIDFYEEAKRTRVRLTVPLLGEAWVQGDALDRGYIRGQVAMMVGEDDERILRWDAMTRGA
jgi:hypothetical protein